MHIAFCDNSFYCKISSDKLERRSDKLIHVRSIDMTVVSITCQSRLCISKWISEWKLYDPVLVKSQFDNYLVL